jgi:O-antigen/teichoic acid export membrane protein
VGLTRQNVFYFCGRLLGALISLVSLIVFTRLLTPADYGRYSVIVAIAGLLAGVLFQWLRQCLVQFGGDVKIRARVLASLGLLFWIAIATTILLAIVAVCAVTFSERDLEITRTDIAVVCAFGLAQAWFEFATDAVRLDLQPLKYGVFNISRAAFSLVFGASVALTTEDLASTILGIALGYAFAGYLAAPRWLRGLLALRLASWQQIKVFMAYGLPLSFTLGMIFILDSVDRLMLAGLRDAATAGVYSSAYNLSQFSIGTILGGLGLGIMPLASAAFHRNESALAKRLIERNLFTLIAIGLPAVIGLCFEAPVLGRLMLGNYQAGESDSVVIIISIAIGLAGLRAYGYDVIFMIHSSTKVQAVILAIAAGINIGLNIVFIPMAGATGAAWATLMAFLFAIVASVVVGRRIVKLDYAMTRIAKVCVATILMAMVLYCVPSKPTWFNLALAVGAGSATYGAALLLLNPSISRSLLRTISNLGVKEADCD